jgi:hypothetical protein
MLPNSRNTGHVTHRMNLPDPLRPIATQQVSALTRFLPKRLRNRQLFVLDAASLVVTPFAFAVRFEPFVGAARAEHPK